MDHVTSRGGTGPLATAATLPKCLRRRMWLAQLLRCDSTWNPKEWRIGGRRAAGAIMLEYYGRNVGIKIMPTGVNCDRLLAGLEWKDTIWRRGELQVPPPRLYPCPAVVASGPAG